MSLQYKRFQQRLQGAKTGLLNQISLAVNNGVQDIRAGLTTMMANLNSKVAAFTDQFKSVASNSAGGGAVSEIDCTIPGTTITWQSLGVFAPTQGSQNALIELSIDVTLPIASTPTLAFAIALEPGDFVPSNAPTYNSIGNKIEIYSVSSSATTQRWTPWPFGSMISGQNPSVGRSTDIVPNNLIINIPLPGIRIGTKGVAIWGWDNNIGGTLNNIILRYRG